MNILIHLFLIQLPNNLNKAFRNIIITNEDSNTNLMNNFIYCFTFLC